MQRKRNRSANTALAACAWCGAALGHNVMPPSIAALFCSRLCEIEANFWLFQEMCEIEITLPTRPPEFLEGRYDQPEDQSGSM